ncbi:hypothetical protein R1sor_019684 [Riccia sorocarpa]|uniref:Glutathione S-transferase n=1 Tax=Riccia sorocarpa TaxID=122646 RepID=A0ABD3IFX6_9MARC
MTLKVYGDYVSQPTTAVLLLCLANKIDFELVPVNLRTGEHLGPEFKAINPTGQVPVIDDDGFILSESTAILRYLAVTRNVPDHWYPKDVKARARIDYLLDWYHTNLRQIAVYVIQKELGPTFWKIPRPDEAQLKPAQGKMTASVEILEEFLLKPEEGPFLLGAPQPSIADLICSCEYTLTRYLPQEEQEELLGRRPKTKKWLKALEKTLGRHYSEINKTLPELLKLVADARSSG